jgi:hypothetical protein
MKKSFWLVLALGLAMLASACGGSSSSSDGGTGDAATGDGGSDGGKTVVNANSVQKDAAVNLTKDISNLTTVKADPQNNALNAFDSLSKVMSDANALFSGNASTTLSEALTAAAATPCYTATATKITYNCPDLPGGHKLSGTIDISGDSYTLNLEATLHTTARDYNLKYTGTVTITLTSLTGPMTLVVESADGTTVKMTEKFTYKDLVLDQNKCPIGGMFDIEATGSSSGVTVTYNFTASFGPKCGDVILYTWR